MTIATIDNSDCLTWLRQLPPNSVDLVFGSPPYEDARTYGVKGLTKTHQDWVHWMVHVYLASLPACKGLVAFVVEGRTSGFSYSATPMLLAAKLHSIGVTLRKPPIFHRFGISGSGGPDWLRNDYEFIICATNGGKLPWSDNTAMGSPPKYHPGGAMSHRMQNGDRKNSKRSQAGYANGDTKYGPSYIPPKIANPGNVIHCKVGGGVMGSKLCHENEAPFPERLAEFFIKSFCPPGGFVADPFAGSGTTLAVAVRHGRNAIGCDIRQSQVELTQRRLQEVKRENQTLSASPDDSQEQLAAGRHVLAADPILASREVQA